MNAPITDPRQTVGLEGDLGAAVARLAEMKPLEFDRVAKAKAEALGVTVTELKKAVKAERRDLGGDGKGRKVILEEVEPWPDEVDGDDLLDQIVTEIRRYVVMPPGGAEATALWVLFTHTLDAFQISPRLLFTSAEKRSGKTNSIIILSKLTARPRPVSNIKAAGIFRLVEKYTPTLLMDEGDTYMGAADEMTGILNSGHYRSMANIVRVDPDTGEPLEYSTWGAYAVAAIGKLEGTLEDRCIIIRLKRRRTDLASEKIEKLRFNRMHGFERLARIAVRWGQDNIEALKDAVPEMPDGLHDRATDNWEPLVAIADLVGGDWPTRAREAALLLSGNTDDSESIHVELLRDIKEIVERLDVDAISSEELCRELVAMDDRPWCEWRKGSAMTKHQLSRALKRYEINSSTVRLGAGSTPKGYYRKQLEDAFARYVQPQLATSPQPAETLTKSPFSTRHTEAPKIQLATPKAAESVTCGDVASLNPDMSVCVRVPDPEADRVDAEERDAIREIDGEEDRSALLDIPDFLRREAAR